MYPNNPFTYSYLAGPAENEARLAEDITAGNCRFALQLYFYKIHHLFLERDQIYLPGGYHSLGAFIFREQAIDYSQLKNGDILYAQNLRNKVGVKLNRNQEAYPTKDAWIYHFHSAIFIRKPDNTEMVWHATSIENGPAFWTRNRFEQYYKVISVKRILP